MNSHGFLLFLQFYCSAFYFDVLQLELLKQLQYCTIPVYWWDISMNWWNIFNRILFNYFLCFSRLYQVGYLFIFFLLWLDNMTPVPQCQWLGMFCTCSAPINLQQVHQLAQQEGTTVLPAHVTQEKCTNGGFCWLISPQRNTDHTCNDLPKSVLTAVWQ